MAIRVLIIIVVRAANEYSWFPWHSANICLASSWVWVQFYDWKVIVGCFGDNTLVSSTQESRLSEEAKPFPQMSGDWSSIWKPGQAHCGELPLPRFFCFVFFPMEPPLTYFWSSVLSPSLTLPCCRKVAGQRAVQAPCSDSWARFVLPGVRRDQTHNCDSLSFLVSFNYPLDTA